jgi:hypothetical protein
MVWAVVILFRNVASALSAIQFTRRAVGNSRSREPRSLNLQSSVSSPPCLFFYFAPNERFSPKLFISLCQYHLHSPEKCLYGQERTKQSSMR